MKLILFDIDGTLLHAGGSGRIAFEKTFEDLYGVKNVWQDLIPDGKTDPAIIAEIALRVMGRALTEVEEEKVANCYQDYFEKEIQNSPKVEILAGVRELLEKLSGREDVVIGIATGNFEKTAQAKLRSGGLHSFFCFGGFASDHANRAELTRIGIKRGLEIVGCRTAAPEIFLIGDTPHDIHVGKTLGITTIAVATGRTSVSEFQNKYRPEYALEDLSDSGQFIKMIESHNVRT